MEGRLFFLSIWCGIYAYLIRLSSRRDDLLEKPAMVMILNSLFWMTFAAMVGMGSGT